ncbi:mobile mystery protein A [Rhodomicrobium lacus]|uniref:mobile mystery protein A n=1 Tax=Rhodomicrobium lacus TaxID=2498452 RepID=UPI000F8E79F4|nr:mobile mystery protein A [Rhodomicrobium lacus]
MSIKRAVREQYQAIVDRAAGQTIGLRVPPEGWLRTMRKALGMSGAQLGRRMGLTRARIAAAEHAELSGAITLKSMQAAAEAMGCRFVYAVVPQTTVEEAVGAQARKKALAIVHAASGHMALESQTLPDDRIARQVTRLAEDLSRAMPPDFWEDK